MKNQKKVVWSRLDQISLDIEFLLISVIQGVALASLSGVAIRPMEMLQWQSFPYIVTGFLLILIFWSGAIIHALSFIDWPLDLIHTFLYFFASFIEVIAFSQINNPFNWFVILLFFQIVAGVLYLYDMKLIKKHKVRFGRNSAKKELFEHIYNQQKNELRSFVPFSIIYSIVAVLAILIFPEYFINKGYHLFLISGQLILSLVFLKNAIGTFKIRSLLLSESEGN